MSGIPLVPAHWRFPAHPASVRMARRAVADTLPAELWPHLGDDLSLLTSELVTNAVRYGTRAEEDESVEVVLWPADGHYWLAVSDPGGEHLRAPKPACPGPESETGRGLLLVDTLASAWTVRNRPVRGTSVVAGVPLRPMG
ncbi:ATP-binding protein [Streptomyces sp. NPDC049954]|uniref:ATP-binding protein n=1 Tax=Streptomyces sp. NPDC049954 TaxID=3155779 RepID=UPI00342617A6